MIFSWIFLAELKKTEQCPDFKSWRVVFLKYSPATDRTSCCFLKIYNLSMVLPWNASAARFTNGAMPVLNADIDPRNDAGTFLFIILHFSRTSSRDEFGNNFSKFSMVLPDACTITAVCPGLEIGFGKTRLRSFRRCFRGIDKNKTNNANVAYTLRYNPRCCFLGAPLLRMISWRRVEYIWSYLHY